MKKLKLLVASLLFGVSAIQAQELSYGYYNYILNQFNLNPALAGINRNVSALLNTKTYQTGFNGAPRNTMFGMHAALNSNQGLGMRILSDKRGGFEVSKYDAVYSYEIKVNEQSDLRFGISAGAIRRMLNANSLPNFELLDQTDPNIASGFFDETNFIAGVGLIYEYENLQLGFSSPHLVDGSSEISEYMVGSIAYEYNIENSKFSLIPTLIYQNIPHLDNQYDFLLKAEYYEKVWVQGGYKLSQNLNFGVGFDFGAFGVGYSYEMNNTPLNNISRNSNEILITIGFNSKNVKEKEKTLNKLDEYSNTLELMLSDNQNRFKRVDIMTEIQKIRLELQKLEKQNNKKKAKAINKRLLVIESQIQELEKRYAK